MTSVTQWLSSDEQRLWRAFLTFKRDLQLRIDAQLRDHGLSESDYAVLVVVAEAATGTVRVKEIADATGWESSRLAHQLRRMEKRDLIYRMPCQEDARGTLVCLTEAGARLLNRASPGHIQQVRSAFLDSLTPFQQNQLHDLLQALTANMPTDGTCNHASRNRVITLPDVTGTPATACTHRPQQRNGGSRSHAQRIDRTAHGERHTAVTAQK